MTDFIVCGLLVYVLIRIFGEGDSIELEDVLGIPQLAALGAFLAVAVLTGLRVRAYAGAGNGHFPALGMLGMGACGVLLVLFPERMPDTVRGGTLMTAFWGIVGWLLLALSAAVVFYAGQS